MRGAAWSTGHGTSSVLPVLLLMVLRALAREPVTGVAPADREKYSTSTFTCANGSEELPAAAVNDNFCDCEDGSDEPGTAACAGLTAAHFYCVNAESVPRLLYSSRVFDGVCDCCDGSDEGGPASGLCPNTCSAEGEALRAERERKREAIAGGLRVQQESKENATAAIASWREEVDRLESELPKLERAVGAAKEIVSSLAASKNSSAEADAQAELALSKEIFSEDFESDPWEETRWARSEGATAEVVQDPTGQRGMVLAVRRCTWGGDVFSTKGLDCNVKSPCRISFWARGAPWQGFSVGTQRAEREGEDAHSWLAVPASSAEFSERRISTQEVDEWVHYEYEFPAEDTFRFLQQEDVTFTTKPVHIMVQAHDSTGRCSETMFDDIKVWSENVIPFLDVDGDKVVFRLNKQGCFDIYGNDGLMVAHEKEVWTEDSYLHFGQWRTQTAPEITERIIATHAEKCLGKAVATPEAAKVEKPAVPEAAEASEPKEAQEPPAPPKAEDAAEPPAEEAPAAPKVPEVSEYSKWALDQKSTKESEYSKWALDQKSTKEKEPDSSSDDEGKQKEKDDRVWSRSSVPTRGRSEEQMKADRALEQAEADLADNRRKREELEKKLASAAENSSWTSMYDTCVEKQIGEYDYKICHFQRASQDHTTLGKFKEWDPETPLAMLYTDGQHCYGGDARRLKVQLQCGPAESLEDVWEPSRCTYEALVTHPLACRQEDLDELEDRSTRARQPHEEL